jgi:hypothetical protein
MVCAFLGYDRWVGSTSKKNPAEAGRLLSSLAYAPFASRTRAENAPHWRVADNERAPAFAIPGLFLRTRTASCAVRLAHESLANGLRCDGSKREAALL